MFDILEKRGDTINMSGIYPIYQDEFDQLCQPSNKSFCAKRIIKTLPATGVDEGFIQACGLAPPKQI